MCATLFLSLLASALAQTTPAGWKIVKDSKGVCQIAVPPDWDPLSENTGAAVFQDATTAIAAVTSQAGQAFKPLPETWQKLLGIRKGKLFENTARRVFYQDKISKKPEPAFSPLAPVTTIWTVAGPYRSAMYSIPSVCSAIDPSFQASLREARRG